MDWNEISHRLEPLYQQYRGTLTPAQAAKGIEVAVENANGLLADAELLLENERWARACALAILAIEELGKVDLLRSLLVATTDKSLREGWKAYRSHRAKNVRWIVPTLAGAAGRWRADFASIPDEDTALTAERIKQGSLYTDCRGDCRFARASAPQWVAEFFVVSARKLIPAEPGAMTSADELEIWTRHMRPVWGSSVQRMKAALMACFAETDARGVLRGHVSPKEMLKYLFDE